MNISEKLDHIISAQATVTEDVANIKSKLLGNEYNKGMIDEFGDLKTSHYKLVGKVQKIWIVGSMLAVVLTFLISIAHHIKDVFS